MLRKRKHNLTPCSNRIESALCSCFWNELCLSFWTSRLNLHKFTSVAEHQFWRSVRRTSSWMASECGCFTTLRRAASCVHCSFPRSYKCCVCSTAHVYVTKSCLGFSARPINWFGNRSSEFWPHIGMESTSSGLLQGQLWDFSARKWREFFSLFGTMTTLTYLDESTGTAENATDSLFAENATEPWSTPVSKGPDCGQYDLIMNAWVKFILLAFGTVGNGLSIVVMWSERRKSATAFLLIILAVVDTLLMFAWIFLVAAPGILFFFVFHRTKLFCPFEFLLTHLEHLSEMILLW